MRSILARLVGGGNEAHLSRLRPVVAQINSLEEQYSGLTDEQIREEMAQVRAEVAEKAPGPNETFRIGGLVEEGSLVRGQGAAITFNVTDGGAAVPVRYEGVLPDLFGENEGVVATGKLIDGTFEATEILAKHDETYMPKEVIDALKDQGVYVDPNAGPMTN